MCRTGIQKHRFVWAREATESRPPRAGRRIAFHLRHAQGLRLPADAGVPLPESTRANPAKDRELLLPLPALNPQIRFASRLWYLRGG